MDSRQISDLINICKDLNSEKARERKNAASKLKSCLSQNSYRKALDQNYDYKLSNKSAGRVFTWDSVFRAACLYVSMETEDLQKANQDVSRTTLTNRESRKREVSGVVKCVIRQADKGCPKLKGTLLFEHIRKVLNDSYTCDAYGQDYSSIFLKNVISVKKYVVELTSKEWHDFLFLFFRLFNEPDIQIDKLVLARIINALIGCMNAQCDMRPKKIFSFFSAFFLRARDHKSPLLIQHMLSAVNVFIKSVAHTSRVQVCKLGEDIVPSILYLWRNVASDGLKDHLLQFLQTQMWCHHPDGVKRECPGAYAVDWDKWMSNLRKMYELLYSEIQQVQTRNRGKGCCLHEAFVDLSVDVCQQLFTESSHIIEVTQISLTGSSSHSGPGTKKRRLESGWEEIRNFITSAGQSTKIVPWLQLVTGYMSKYPTSIPQDEVYPYLTCLSHILVDCKRADLMKYVMCCINAFVTNWDKVLSVGSESLQEQTTTLWTQVWMVTLRFVSLHNAEPDGYSLLSAMVKRKLESPKKDIWSLFIPSLTQPVTESVTFLHNLLTFCDIPENYVPNLVISLPNAQTDVKFPLRKQLIHWLLPSNEDDCDMPVKHYKLDPDWTALTLVALTLRNIPAVRYGTCLNLEVGKDPSTLELQYLELDLERPLQIEELLVTGAEKDSISDAAHIPTLLLEVENLIKSEAECYCRTVTEQMTDVKEMVGFTRLVFNILSLLLENHIVTLQTVYHSSVYTCLVSLLTKVSTSLQDIVKKEGFLSLGIVLNQLRFLFEFKNCDSKQKTDRVVEIKNVMASVLRAATPSRLIDLLLDLTNDKHSQTKQMSKSSVETSVNNSRFSRGASRLLDDLDDEFDLEFENISDNNNTMEIDDLEFDDATESQETEETNLTNEVCQSLLSRNILSENQSMRLEALYILCHLCSSDCNVKDNNEVNTKYIKSKIIKLLDDGLFDPLQHVDVQMMVCIVKIFTTKHQTLSEKHLTAMIGSIRKCVKCHSRDQEVCQVSLELLVLLIPHVTANSNIISSGLQECQESILRLVNAFWQLQEDIYITSVRARLASVIEMLVQYDPDCDWSRFPEIEDDDSSNSQGEKGASPVSRFIDCIGDSSHLVRMQVASSVYKLFLNMKVAGQPPLSRISQNNHLELLVNTISEALDIQGKLSPERLEDEKLTRNCSMVVALGTVICSSSVCEKAALFAMIKFIQDRNVSVESVQKMLNKVSRHLGYIDCFKYLECHLPYLIDRWLDGSPLIDFPIKILGCADIRQFYMKFARVIIPILVAKQNLTGIETVASALEVSSEELLKKNIPLALSYILPVFAAGKKCGDDFEMKKKVNKATCCYKLLCKALSEEIVNRHIENSLDDIVASLLMCLYDPQSDNIVICNSNAEPNSPFYSSEVITWTLDYITSSFSGSGKTLIEKLSKTPDSIQKILLQLSSSLWSCHRFPEKRRRLLMYRLFTKLLLKQLHTRLGGAWAFVIRDVIHQLVFIVEEMTESLSGDSDSIDTDSHYRKNIACIALELLQEVCHVGMESCPKELEKYLPFLISNLMSASVLSGDVGKLSLGLLKYLVLEKAGDFQGAITALENFPDRPVFKECRVIHQKLKYAAGSFTLKKEIEHFLNSCKDQIISPEQRVEGLKFLYEQLKLEHQQIISLATDETLCKLVCELIQLSKCCHDDVMHAAGRCLGVIGPINLRSISLPSPPESTGLQIALQCFEEIPDVHKYCRIFHHLNKYLTDKSIELAQCTSQVLKNLLACKKGIEFSSGYKTQLGDNEYLFHYLHPFRCNKKKIPLIVIPKVNWETFVSSVDQMALWNPQHSSHKKWVMDLTSSLINSGAVRDELLQLLGPVCCIKAEFCELVLPYLIHDILISGTDEHREVISRHVVNFFSTHCSQSTSGRVSRCHSAISHTDVVQLISMNCDSVRTMLSIVQYLRQQHRPKTGRQEMTSWDNNFWLDVDYLQVAMAAKYCTAHFTALLYAEIWCDVQREKTGSKHSSLSQRSSQSLSQDTRIDTLSEASCMQSGVSVQDLLLDAYTWIGDPDGVYGCGAGRNADASSRICTYEQENMWDKAVVSCDIQVSQSRYNNQNNQLGLLHALQNFGASHVFNTYLKGIVGQEDSPSITSDTRELQFEAAWKMGQWTLDTSNKLETDTGFHESLYKAMNAVKEDHYTFAFTALDSARLCAISKLKDGCLDSARRLYPVLADLKCVNIVSNMARFLKKEAEYTDLKVFSMDVDTDCNIEFTLPTLLMQCSALQLLWEKSQKKEVFNIYVDSLQQLAIRAREAVRHQVSERAIAQLKGLDISDLAQSIPTQIEEAKLYWARGEESIAKHLLKATLERVRKIRSTDRAAARFYPQTLSIYGNWLAETRSENPNIIMENYMEKAINMYKKLGEDETQSMDAYLSLGRYADTQYQNIVNYMNSSTFEAKQSLMNKSIQEAQRLRDVTGTTPDRYLRILEKQTAIDKHELECMEEDRNTFLVKAVENYIKCMRSGEAHNLRVFRLTSLWFNNVCNEDVNAMMKEAVNEIKTYKWLPLMYQLAARMDVKPHKDIQQEFLDTLNKLIYNTAVSHPHHTLFCVLALANANRDTELLQQAKTSKRGTRLSKTQTDSPSEEGRVLAAKNMIGKLKNDNTVGKIVKDMQTLCDAYIQLANWNVQEYKTQTKAIQLPSQLWLTKVRDLTNVPVPTKDIKVSASCDYRDISFIVKFEATFKLAGGINLPKIVSCVGSDGRKSRQLVKGKDDLRQDAVMQQVFEMVNNLLQKDSETRKRKLQIRKYKVIPLSQRSGLLEWCEGTQPIGEYLIGSKGAHTRYRPIDLPSYECRNRLAAATTTEQKYKTYEDICEKFQPVFRHFFLEKFLSPAVWFERRLAYTRSVATNSIVGYILGLGDRHPQNILIDCNSAELVHIDLGIAFEQGKILPTPETVPFRLTRDIEDAMGASGVEGVFRRCCEKTMEVMRNNQEALLTILEVLLYDPLHVWTISPAKAYVLQQRHGREDCTETVNLSEKNGDMMDITVSSTSNEAEENVNKVAERVLLRLRQKLQGIEDSSQLSLSGQVNYLIQEARNFKNLARIFPGWQPYI